MSEIFTMPDLSNITTEIDIDSMNSAYSVWNSSIASLDINPSGIKSAFQPLNNNGVATGSIESIASALNQISQLITSIGNYLKNNLENQTIADDSILNKASESSVLSDLIPIDQYNLGYSQNTATYFDSSGYGSYTSIDNKSQDLSINKDTIPNIESLSGSEFIDNKSNLGNINNNGGSDSVSIDMNKYSDITNQNLENIENDNDLNEIVFSGVGEKVVDKTLEQLGENNFVSDEIKEIIYKYIKNKVLLTGVNYNNANEYFSKFPSISDDINKILNENRAFIDLYDGNKCSDINKDSLSFIRGMIDGLAENKSVTAEELLTDSSYFNYLVDGMKEISQALTHYQNYL